MGGEAAEGARIAAEHRQKMGELAVQAEREQANVELAVHQGTIAARLASDISLADKEYAIQLQGNRDLQNALDRGGKDYQNQLRGLQDKAAELTLQHTNQVAELRGRATVESYQKDLSDFEEAEREKIDATDRGGAARLAAIDNAIREEQARNLQNTQHYKELLTQRVEAARQAMEEEAKLQAEMGKEAAEQAQKTGELSLAAEREAWALRITAERVSAQMQVDAEKDFAEQEYNLKLAALARESAALDQHARDYQLKLQEINDKEKQLTQQHENEMTEIEDRAAKERNEKQANAMRQFEEMYANGLTEVIMGHKSFAAMMDETGNQVVSGMMRNALMSIMTLDMTKEREAAAAARKMYLAGAALPFPVNIVAAPVMGAAAFASMMAFAEGGIVPGTGGRRHSGRHAYPR